VYVIHPAVSKFFFGDAAAPSKLLEASGSGARSVRGCQDPSQFHQLQRIGVADTASALVLAGVGGIWDPWILLTNGLSLTPSSQFSNHLRVPTQLGASINQSLFVSTGLTYKSWTESATDWFDMREKHYWLADKPSQIQAVID